MKGNEWQRQRGEEKRYTFPDHLTWQWNRAFIFFLDKLFHQKLALSCFKSRPLTRVGENPICIYISELHICLRCSTILGFNTSVPSHLDLTLILDSCGFGCLTYPEKLTAGTWNGVPWNTGKRSRKQAIFWVPAVGFSGLYGLYLWDYETIFLFSKLDSLWWLDFLLIRCQRQKALMGNHWKLEENNLVKATLWNATWQKCELRTPEITPTTSNKSWLSWLPFVFLGLH